MCGFKGLGGKILIFRNTDKKLIGETTSNGASLLNWSVDEQYFLTAIVQAKLKTGNVINIYKNTGEFINNVKIIQNDLLTAEFLI